MPTYMNALPGTSLPHVLTDRTCQHGGLTPENSHVESETKIAFERQVMAPPFPAAIPTLSTMPDLDMSLRTLMLDIGRHPALKMSAMKPEVEIHFGRKEMAQRF